MFRSWFCLFSLGIALLCPQGTEARDVRVATYNVRQGVGEVGSAEYTAVHRVLQRTDADIIAFQELNSVDRANWEALALELGYTSSPYSDWTGLSGNLYTGYFSRWPILTSRSVHSPAGANEISRPPFHIEVDVPGAAYPLALWTLHHKALSGGNNEFRRAIEARRAAQDMDAYLAGHPGHVECIVLGDFNEDADQSQTDQFFSLPTGLPGSYSLGSDIHFPVPYRAFPRDAYEVVGAGMKMLSAYHEDSSDDSTFIGSSGRLDYIFVSTAIFTSALGAPETEIYNSALDDGAGGLPKAGSALPAATSATASDHYLVFVDLKMMDSPAPANEIPADWRLLYFGHAAPLAGDLSRALDDADGDGYTNLDEYIGGSHPQLTADVPGFADVVTSSTQVDLAMATLTGRVYSIEYADTLSTPGAWGQLPGCTAVPGTGGTVIHTDSAAPTFRAYRLRIALEP